MEIKSKEFQQEQQFNVTVEMMYNQYLGKSSIERDDEILLEENQTKKMMLPLSGAVTPISPYSSLLSVEVSLGKEAAINQAFFQFIKDSSSQQCPFNKKG